MERSETDPMRESPATGPGTGAPDSGTSAASPAAPEPRTRKLFRTGPLTKEEHDRLTIFVVRAFFFFIAAGLGLYGVDVLKDLTGRQDLDPLVGVLVACGTALGLILLEAFFSKSPVRTLSAITFGLIVGLALSLVFQFVVDFIVVAVSPATLRADSNYPAFLSFLHMLTTTIFCYFGVTVLLQTKDDFKFIIPYVEFRKEVRSHTPLLFDTSCFVDGRILGLAATGVFDQRFVVPNFVLQELQTIADSSDKSLRERGRRGLDILHEIERLYSVEVVEHALRPGEDVDSALIAVGNELGGRLVTTDFNLQKSAKVKGIPVLNINDLATALKPAFVPGETMNVRLLREGDDKGQAVGFLNDGTMVVVENARQRIGQEVSVEVTSSIQTSAGKMVFGKLRRPSRNVGEP